MLVGYQRNRASARQHRSQLGNARQWGSNAIKGSPEGQMSSAASAGKGKRRRNETQ